MFLILLIWTYQLAENTWNIFFQYYTKKTKFVVLFRSFILVLLKVVLWQATLIQTASKMLTNPASTITKRANLIFNNTSVQQLRPTLCSNKSCPSRLLEDLKTPG